MATIFVIPAAPSTWDHQQRVDSVAGSPLSPEGVATVRAAAEELARPGTIKAIYACAGESEREGAELLAAVLDVKVRTRKDLRELDYGMWQGLRLDEIRRRQPKIYKQWRDAPEQVSPPGGESLGEVQARLRAVVREVTAKHKNDAAAMVLRPVAMELLRRIMDGRSLADFWTDWHSAPEWDSYEMDARTI